MMAYLGTGEPSPFPRADALLAAGNGCKFPVSDAEFCGGPVATATGGGRRRQISYCCTHAAITCTREGFQLLKLELRA